MNLTLWISLPHVLLNQGFQLSLEFYQVPTDLAVIPWGGTTKHGIVLANTCPVDNWLMRLLALVKSGRIDLDDLTGAGNVNKTARS